MPQVLMTAGYAIAAALFLKEVVTLPKPHHCLFPSFPCPLLQTGRLSGTCISEHTFLK